MYLGGVSVFSDVVLLFVRSIIDTPMILYGDLYQDTPLLLRTFICHSFFGGNPTRHTKLPLSKIPEFFVEVWEPKWGNPKTWLCMGSHLGSVRRVPFFPNFLGRNPYKLMGVSPRNAGFGHGPPQKMAQMLTLTWECVFWFYKGWVDWTLMMSSS